MNAPFASGLLAIDVGSSRVKLGWFPASGDCPSDKPAGRLPIAAPRLPQPEATLAVSHDDQTKLWTEIGGWLQEFCPGGPPVYVASVEPTALAIVQEMFAQRLRPIGAGDLPIEVRVEQPERVGIDRLLNAVAVNRLRQAGRPALVVDLGTANTIDLISEDGAFEGGAILPGISLAASALHTGTAALPRLEIETLETLPTLVGKSTRAAILSGLYWGTVGAVRALVERIGRECDRRPQVFFTGGGATQIAEHFSAEHLSAEHFGEEAEPVRLIPHLVLAGIALVAEDLS